VYHHDIIVIIVCCFKSNWNCIINKSVLIVSKQLISSTTGVIWGMGYEKVSNTVTNMIFQKDIKV